MCTLYVKYKSIVIPYIKNLNLFDMQTSCDYVAGYCDLIV